MKKTISSALSLIIILSYVLIIFTFNTGKAEAAVFSISSNRLFKDPSPNKPNTFYFVGMVYYEVWKNSGGSWTGAGHHPDSVVRKVDGGTYEFTFGTNRKIKSIEVKQFDFSWTHANATFQTSRTGELKDKSQEYYQGATSIVNYNNYEKTPVSGLGTNKAQKAVYVQNGVLTAKNRIDRKLEEQVENDQVFAPGVEGYRYYFPTLFAIELEPPEGMAIIQHFDTKGNPLNGIDGFTDKEMKLEKGKDYTFPHTAPGEKYTYEGHKKSTRETYKTR